VVKYIEMEIEKCVICDNQLNSGFDDQENKKCIFHCEKSEKNEWFNLDDNDNKKWNSEKTKKFWSELRKKKYIEENDSSVYYVDFSDFIFPKFENSFMEIKSDKKDSEVKKIFYAQKDFNFWRDKEKVVFKKSVSFEDVIFMDNADFLGTQFCENVNFINTIFEKNLYFYGCRMRKKSIFENIHIKESSFFWDAKFSSDLSFINVKMDGKGFFQNVKFSDNGKTLFEKINIEFEKINIEHEHKKKEIELKKWKVPILDFENVVFNENIVFRSCNLSRFNFRNSIKLKTVKLEKIYFSSESQKIYKNLNMNTEEEIYIYSQLMKNFRRSDNKKYFSMFYVKKMNLIQKTTKNLFKKFVLFLYKNFALYGESPVRIIFFMFLFLFSISFYLFIFANKEFINSLFLPFEFLFFIKNDFDVRFIFLIERIFFVFAIPILFMSISRKIKK